MSKLSKLKFDIPGHRKIFYIISAVIIVIGVASMLIQGFNFDIDFTGGTAMSVRLNEDPTTQTINDIRDMVQEVTGELPTVQRGSGDLGFTVDIKMKAIDNETRDQVFEKLKSEYNLTDEDRLSVDNVDPVVGEDLRNKAILATAIASLLMLVYIWIRFELLTGISAVLCLLHDVFVVLAVYSLLQIPMNMTFIAAILTILGYSINATIIVFDRVRENRKLSHKESFEATVNTSIWQTMNRSVNTTITTLLTIGMIYILGVPSIKVFAFPIICGIVSGLYSSVFLSGSLWVTLHKIFKKAKGKV